MNPTNFLTELKRRNVYRAAIAYGVVAWFLTQLTTQVFPFFEIPNSAVRFVVIALAIGFPIAMLLSWLYELTPEGIVRTEDLDPVQARSVQRASGRILDFIIIGVLLLVIAMMIVGRLPFYRQTGESISEKSIAVLPFENLSRDPDNAYFATGIQNEILTRLAKIAALKVISHTSTQQYPSRPGNLREIAGQLGVANVLEGSVQKAADQVHINVQLIRAATDEHLWAESYDRKLEHFSEAVKLDPKFAIAWAWLARVSALGYFNSAGNDVAALRETAKNAVAKVAQLQPKLGEAFLAQGYFHYFCEQNYDAAIASFEKARLSVPRTSDALEGLALVSRRKGEWRLSLEYFRQAIEIDPRNASLLASYGDTYVELREYSFALKVYDQLLEISPDNVEALVSKAAIYQCAANLSEAAALLSRVASDPSYENFFVQIWQRIYERRFADAIAMVRDAIATRDLPPSAKAIYSETLADLKAFTGDTIGARTAWQQLRDEVESSRRQMKEEQFGFEVLAAADAALGDQRKALAIVDQEQVDALNVGGLAYLRARIAVYAGDKDSAIEQLATAAHNPVPGGPGYSATYGDLKLNPVWDTLRGDPRFEEIVASLAPKPAAQTQ